MHHAFGMATRAMSVELAARDAVQIRLGQDRTRGIAGAEEQYVIHCLRALLPLYRDAADFRTPPTTIVHQEGQQGAHPLVVRRVNDAATLSLRREQPRLFQLLQVERERRCGDLNGGREVASRCAVRTEIDEIAEYGEPGVLGEGGQSSDGVSLFHISTIMEQ